MASVTSEHDRIIGALGKPYWMLNQSPCDNTWTIRKHSGNVRGGDVTVHFDVAIAPNIRSTDLECDLITAKKLAYRGLSGNDARYESGSTIPINTRNYFAYVRWRYSRGIERNSHLTKDDIDALLEDLEARGIVGLSPYQERLAELAGRIESGEFQVPFRTKGAKRFARKVALLEELGAPHTAGLPISLSRALDDLLLKQGFSVEPRMRSGDAPEEDDVADEAALSENRLISFLTAPQLLFYYRKHLEHDPISFEPFEGEDGITQVAKALSRVTAQRTFTTPTYQACFLIDQAITWITVYFEEIRCFADDLKLTIAKFASQHHWRPAEAAFNERLRIDWDKYSKGPGSWWPIHPSYFASPGWVNNVGSYRPSLRPVLFELLATAALVVIAAFSARRKEEMGSLKEDCVTTIDEEYWLETWISKNIRGMDKIPVPTTVKRAVDVLLWLSEGGRKASGAKWLLDFGEIVTIGDGSKLTKPCFKFYKELDRFAEFAEVPLIDGKRWVPKPAEFRRFFGITYFHRFDYPNLVALSDFYRHFNPTRTRGYITELTYGTSLRWREDKAERVARMDRRKAAFDADRLKDFHECGLQNRIDLVCDAITGEGYMTGFGGAAIVTDAKKQIQDYKNQIQLGPTESLDRPTLNDVLRSMLEPMSCEPHPAGHSGCKCTGKPQDLATAACLKIRSLAHPNAPPASGPDIEFATEFVCAGCVHNVQLPCHRPWWEKALEHEVYEAEHALLPFLREIAGCRAEAIGAVITRCHAQFPGGGRVREGRIDS